MSRTAGSRAAGPVERPVDEPVEGAAALHRPVGEARGLRAGPRVELGAAHLGGERAIGVGALVHAAQHAQGDAALARDPLRRVGGGAHARAPGERAAPAAQERAGVHPAAARRLELGDLEASRRRCGRAAAPRRPTRPGGTGSTRPARATP